MKGIEPSSFGWEPRALPLSYTRRATHFTQVQAVAAIYLHVTAAPGDERSLVVLGVITAGWRQPLSGCNYRGALTGRK